MTQISDIQSKAVETIISFIGGMYRNNEVQTLDNGDVAGGFDHEIGNSLSAACEWSASDRFAYIESLVVMDETLGEEVVLTASDLEEIKSPLWLLQESIMKRRCFAAVFTRHLRIPLKLKHQPSHNYKIWI